MYCFVMQPWQTIRSDKTVTSVTQTEACWLDLLPYQDIVAWLEVKEFTVGGGTAVQMAYQTSPAKDDSLFVPVVNPFTVALGVTNTVMLKDSATNTLSRWLRWRITITGSPTSAWDATFRVFIAANIVGRGNRPKTLASAWVASVPAPMASSPALAGSGSFMPSLPLHIAPAGSGTSTGIMSPGTGAGSVSRYQPVPPQPVLNSFTGFSNVQATFTPVQRTAIGSTSGSVNRGAINVGGGSGSGSSGYRNNNG